MRKREHIDYYVESRKGDDIVNWKELYEKVYASGAHIIEHPIFIGTKNNVQHQHTNTYFHSICVAMMAIYLVDRFHLQVDQDSLICGCLLHDLFLYDWHIAKVHFHGFRHPSIALSNAKKYFEVNAIEADVIKHHMFPLTPHPPVTKEGWIITIADKLVSIREVFHQEIKEIGKVSPQTSR